MRDSVRRLCSLLTASKPSPIAINGTRKPSMATKDGKGSRASVNRRSSRNGSSAVFWRRLSIAP